MVDGCTLARPAVADDERVGVGGAGEDCGAVQRCRIHEGAAVIAVAAVVVQHFAAVKRRLAPGGLFCQWLPLHQLDLVSLASIVRSYQAVFPEAVAVLAEIQL